MSTSSVQQGPRGPAGPPGPTGPSGASAPGLSAGHGLLKVDDWSSGGGSLSLDYDQVVLEVLRRLGLRPGDRLVVRSADGGEREVPLTPLDLVAAREVVDE